MSFFALSLFAKAKQHFRHQTRLSTYGRSIHALAISNDGQALACCGNLTRTMLSEVVNRRAGTEGIKLWDIKSQKELTCSTHHHESHGTISCTVWITTRQGMAATLCYGTGLGYIVFLRRSHIDVRGSW
jgi:alpha-tubulin suppressor-like RCC1 family protein